MKNYIHHQYYLAKRLLLIMIFMTLTRLVFYILNYHLFSALDFGQVLLHFIYGLRFDLATISIANLLFVLLSVFPTILLNKGWYQKTMKIVFVVINSCLMALNMVDSKFYEFEGKRLTADFFNKEWLGEDFFTLLPEFIKDYWYVLLIFGALVVLVVKLYPKFEESKKQWVTDKNRTGLQAGTGILILAILVIVGRGGIQLKPIGVISAAQYTTPENMALVLNTPFTIIKTLGWQSLTDPQYFPDDELSTAYNPVHDYGKDHLMNKKNVVIIVLESFGKEYSGFLNNKKETFMPNLDSIMRRGLACTNAFANGKRSLDALPAIMSGIPAIMDNAFITSNYTANRIDGLGSLLQKQGYYCAFYHGGKNGTMGFDNFMKLAGVENYFGLNEYPRPQDYDGNWGIPDYPYLQYFCQELTAMKEPFFASVFTLSSHHPYQIPAEFDGKFPKGNLINLESIGYADYSLGEFFKSASKQPWYRNTLFVLCADHTAQTKGGYYKTNVGKYAIPIVLFAPGDSTLSGINTNICQHADIGPTILDYLKYPDPFIAFGTSIFDSTNLHGAVSYTNGVYQLIYRDISLNFNGKELVSVESIVGDSVMPITNNRAYTEQINKGDTLLKALIQQFNVRMAKNEMKYVLQNDSCRQNLN
jgi:phosphoglycerol transferase MdoB-like AlkP superfamily enzyme